MAPAGGSRASLGTCSIFFRNCGEKSYSRWGVERVGRVTVNTNFFFFALNIFLLATIDITS